MGNLSPTRSTVLRLGFFLFLIWLFHDTIIWATIRAIWSPSSANARDETGACWAYIGIWWQRLVYGDYPAGELWRPKFVAVAMLVLIAAMVTLRHRLGYRTVLVAASLAWLVAAVILKRGTWAWNLCR
ncbi:hypothetical protein FNJ84_15065 [Paracoccus sp. M683]|uniref:hypothetical protein n=1 Tax=Paracoccus sp. M683 TaxID=2594268 RepID=UPI00117DF0D6|nr:hypothetical protein [Paracoccus sp. M683]TRW95704.1 hypothetical protein FNJ84_15065 [Paracoccus sp. M683]